MLKPPHLLRQVASKGRQAGMVLVLGLVVLVVLTLLVVSMYRMSVIELKIGGASHIEAANFANAEVGINQFIEHSFGYFAPGCLGLPRTDPASCFFSTGSGRKDVPSHISVSGGTGSFTGRVALSGATTVVTATELSCGRNAQRGSGNDMSNAFDTIALDIRGEAQSNVFGGEAVAIHQGFRAPLPPNSCVQ